MVMQYKTWGSLPVSMTRMSEAIAVIISCHLCGLLSVTLQDVDENVKSRLFREVSIALFVGRDVLSAQHQSVSQRDVPVCFRVCAGGQWMCVWTGEKHAMCVTVACVFVYSIYLGGVDKIERCVRRISMPLPLGRYLLLVRSIWYYVPFAKLGTPWYFWYYVPFAQCIVRNTVILLILRTFCIIYVLFAPLKLRTYLLHCLRTVCSFKITYQLSWKDI